MYRLVLALRIVPLPNALLVRFLQVVVSTVGLSQVQRNASVAMARVSWVTEHRRIEFRLSLSLVFHRESFQLRRETRMHAH
jgi:hypothetical protein